jgi:hypothetical protein
MPAELCVCAGIVNVTYFTENYCFLCWSNNCTIIETNNCIRKQKGLRSSHISQNKSDKQIDINCNVNQRIV